MTCVADCFFDGSALRPINQPGKLVWRYRQAKGKPEGELEALEVTPCPCGCGRHRCGAKADGVPMVPKGTHCLACHATEGLRTFRKGFFSVARFVPAPHHLCGPGCEAKADETFARLFKVA